jgi:hypothetical protein
MKCLWISNEILLAGIGVAMSRRDVAYKDKTWCKANLYFRDHANLQPYV